MEIKLSKQQIGANKRWSNQEEREKAKIRTLEQFADPVKRAKHQEAVLAAMQDPEILKRLSESHKGYKQSSEHIEKKRNRHIGRKRSIETGERIAAGARRRWASYSDERKAEILHLVAVNNNTPSSLEEELAKILIDMNIEFDRWYKIPPYVCDFYLPEHNLVIEADGEYWHKDKDAEIKRDVYIASKGFRILHLTGKQIYSDPEQLITLACQKVILCRD